VNPHLAGWLAVLACIAIAVVDPVTLWRWWRAAKGNHAAVRRAAGVTSGRVQGLAQHDGEDADQGGEAPPIHAPQNVVSNSTGVAAQGPAERACCSGAATPTGGGPPAPGLSDAAVDAMVRAIVRVARPQESAFFEVTLPREQLERANRQLAWNHANRKVARA
jgi:hypothetical protein